MILIGKIQFLILTFCITINHLRNRVFELLKDKHQLIVWDNVEFEILEKNKVCMK
jgi:hypothetical protein